MKNSTKQIQAAMLLVALLLMAGQALAQIEGYVPSVRALFPTITSSQATNVPPTVTVGYEGVDPDSEEGVPTHVRFLFTAAEVNGQPVESRFEYEQHVDELVDFANPEWSPWLPYPELAEQRRITFPDLTDQQYYLMAFQVMDTTGAVSLDRDYGQEVFHMRVRTDLFRPAVQLAEYYLGVTTTNRVTEIASGQPLNFSWNASAAAYGGTIVSYRHGFDLVDSSDPNDPGWAVPPGTGPQNLFAQERTFNEGYHIFTLRVVDDSGQVNTLEWHLNVVPFVPLDFQYPLLVIDQVIDDNSNMWPDESGAVAYDREPYRDAYWQFLDGTGGVSGFDWTSDHVSQYDQISYSDLVAYRTVLITARAHPDQLLMNQFRPVNGQDRYVWLTPYQLRGGNVFLVGERSMESFLEAQPNYMVPIMFTSPEEVMDFGGNTYVVGFGQTMLPDGSMVDRGPRQYSYATAGIATLDWTVPVGKYIYGRLNLASQDRKPSCAGVKALVVDPDFKARHLGGGVAFADTIGTNSLIDWRDQVSDLTNDFPFRGDEFVDANITTRPTPWLPQECLDGPDGLCVEPMFRAVARLDWLRELKHNAGDPDWPSSTYAPAELEAICGELALNGTMDSALTNDQVVGYFSHSTVTDKPSGKPDVYWGFDPYRFDPTETQQAVRWVLEYFGLNINN